MRLIKRPLRLLSECGEMIRKSYRRSFMNHIKGIHHVSMKCCGKEEYEKTVSFYGNVLGLQRVRTWAEGTMFDTGNGLIEIFNNGDSQPGKGVIRHFAFAADDVDACADRIAAAGYEVFIRPKNIEIPSDPKFPARIAFCTGPLGEEIEFFQEKASK